MARSAASDPIRDFKFVVEIHPTDRLRNLMGGGTGGAAITIGFAAISGLTVTNEVVSYREGGMNTHPHKLVGQSDYGAVTFSRGVFPTQNQLYRWQQFMHTWNSGAANVNGSVTGANDYRCTIGVKVLDHPASGSAYITDPTQLDQSIALPSMRLGYVLYNCWPGAFAMTDLNAASSGILVQQITVHHEGFQIVTSPTEFQTALTA